ncbi:hypothetical protein VTK56DRAFT_7977 [Thermocarpiscus australiensis]
MAALTMTKIIAGAILAFVGVAAAAEFPPNMPECGKICAKNMLAKCDELNCSPGDVVCLCSNVNFGYGIRDCSVQVCGNITLANIAIDWANKFCESAGVTANIASATESATASPVTTSTWTSVLTSGSSTVTVTGETTISGISGVAGATSVPEVTMTSPIVETHTHGSSTFETTVGQTTIASSITGPALSSALSSQAEEATSTSTAQGAQATVAPALGILAAAGIAAALI